MMRGRLVITIIILFLVFSGKTYDFDVIVVGGGEAGVAAAYQARQLNVSVALIEETDYIGGMSTAAGVTSMNGNFEGFHRTGFYKNYTDRITEYYTKIGRKVGVCYFSDQNICFEPGVGQQIFRQMLKEVNVTVYELSYPVSAFYDKVNKRTLAKVIFSDSKTLSAKVFIDATEYGDLLEVANVKFRAGNKISPDLNPNGCVQKITYTAVMKQYDVLPDFLKFKSSPPGYNIEDWNKAVTLNGSNEMNKYPWSWEFFKTYRGMPDSTRPNRKDLTKTGIDVHENDVDMKVTHLDRDNRFSLNCYGKLKTLQFAYYIQTQLDSKWSMSMDEKYDSRYNLEHQCSNIPSTFKAFERYMPVIPYIRESRRLYGLYTLNANDTYRTEKKDAKEFEDSIAIGDYEEDLHGCDDMESDINEVNNGRSTVRKAFEIPMRSLIPETVDGLITAGKLISVSRLSNGATRNQPVSMLTGQAAGIIAALAVKKNIQPRAVNYKDVQQVLARLKTAYKANPKSTK